ncbi:MAG: SUMF1/EgtB/PvdO family nonheme iron enzyme [Leptospiraceae bacterium]|nr:SUMF1/EgtB/PvdO family nonheme iron enzyme [Leptospiraceae bacterium]MCP5510970.1 SUMF1/EgtB/PvdO family nonheme iron enzyme [Leptospiraceae bacterium]
MYRFENENENSKVSEALERNVCKSCLNAYSKSFSDWESHDYCNSCRKKFEVELDLRIQANLELRSKNSSKGDNPKTFQNKSGVEFIKIPKGKNIIGANAELKKGKKSEEKIPLASERPAHWVEMKKDFYMSIYPITFKQFSEVTGRKFSNLMKLQNYPVTGINFYEAENFIKELNLLEATCPTTAYRLPTEAEWEYSARANSYARYYWGNDMDSQFVWFQENSSGYPQRCGRKKKNSFGLYDMIGNVWEWCSDWYDENYYSASPNENPSGPKGGIFKVARGGSFLDSEVDLRITARKHFLPESKMDNLGFRLVKMV